MKLLIQLVTFTLCAISGIAQAGEMQNPADSNIKVKWEKPSTYTDLMKNHHQDPQLRLKKLDKIWQVAAKQLPDNYRLEVIVHDVDLAGDYRNSTFDARYFSDVYYPKMNFSYQVYDQTGKLVIAADNISIDDKAFLSRSTFKANSTEYYFEQKMLHDWVKTGVIAQLSGLKANS